MARPCSAVIFKYHTAKIVGTLVRYTLQNYYLISHTCSVPIRYGCFRWLHITPFFFIQSIRGSRSLSILSTSRYYNLPNCSFSSQSTYCKLHDKYLSGTSGGKYVCITSRSLAHRYSFRPKAPIPVSLLHQLPHFLISHQYLSTRYLPAPLTSRSPSCHSFVFPIPSFSSPSSNCHQPPRRSPQLMIALIPSRRN